MSLSVSYSINRDHDLWGKFKEGDKSALDKIYYEHITSLLRYGRKLTNKTELVDDCIQDLFFDLWVKRTRLGSTNTIKYYLFKSLKRRVHRAVKSEAIFEPFANQSDPVESPFLAMEAADEGRHSKSLKKCLHKLTPTQREIIFLRFYNDLSFDEISEILELTKKQLYNSLSKAMIKLRGAMVFLLLFY